MRTFRAPGRANLIGEHTDHTDGLVLPAAIDRAVTLEADLGGPAIVLRSAQADGEVVVAADGSQVPADGWGRFVAAVAAELDAAGREPIGLRGQLASDLPQGSGLSSSAALEVVVATALCAAAEFELPPLELAALCRRAEYRAVGVPSGIMDQAASLVGRAGHGVLLDCGVLTYEHVLLPEDHVLLLIDTGVRRQLETSGYAQRSDELQAALPALGGRRPAEVDVGDLDRVLRGVDAIPARRLRHVVTENARVLAAAAAFEAHDLAAIGELFAASHASLRDDYEVTIPELDALVDLAGEAGATAARMTGAGFGGAIVALAPAAEADRIGDEVEEAYRRRFPDHNPMVLRCLAADGAGEVT